MKWTEQEIEILKLRYVKPLDISAIALELGKTKPAIKLKAAHLGLCVSRDLRDDEVEYLKSNALKKSITEMSITLGRSWNTIRKTLKLHNINYLRPCHNRWEPCELELDYIRTNHTSKLEDIARTLKKSIPTINRIMKQLGLMRPKVFKPKLINFPKPPKVPRVKKEKNVKQQQVQRDAGINRIREAMERINRI